MARKTPISSTKVTRLEARTRAIFAVNRLVFAVFCVACGFVVVAASVPQKRKLDLMLKQQREAEAMESAIVAERDDRLDEYLALKEDPAFLEAYARDRLDYYRNGERVLRIKRGE